jgi:hypothetical protein
MWSLSEYLDLGFDGFAQSLLEFICSTPIHQQQFCQSYISNIGGFRFMSGKGRSARKAENLTAICEPII